MKEHRKYFKPDEYQWFLRLGGAISDPEEKKSFFETVMEKKRINSRYSLFDDFPQEGSKEAGLKICAEIIEMLKRGKRNEDTA